MVQVYAEPVRTNKRLSRRVKHTSQYGQKGDKSSTIRIGNHAVRNAQQKTRDQLKRRLHAKDEGQLGLRLLALAAGVLGWISDIVVEAATEVPLYELLHGRVENVGVELGQREDGIADHEHAQVSAFRCVGGGGCLGGFGVPGLPIGCEERLSLLYIVARHRHWHDLFFVVSFFSFLLREEEIPTPER